MCQECFVSAWHTEISFDRPAHLTGGCSCEDPVAEESTRSLQTEQRHLIDTQIFPPVICTTQSNQFEEVSPWCLCFASPTPTSPSDVSRIALTVAGKDTNVIEWTFFKQSQHERRIAELTTQGNAHRGMDQLVNADYSPGITHAADYSVRISDNGKAGFPCMQWWHWRGRKGK